MVVSCYCLHLFTRFSKVMNAACLLATFALLTFLYFSPHIFVWGSNFLFDICRPPPPPPAACLYQLASIHLSPLTFLYQLQALWSPWTPSLVGLDALLCVAGAALGDSLFLVALDAISGHLGRRACFARQARRLVTLCSLHLVTLYSLWSP